MSRTIAPSQSVVQEGHEASIYADTYGKLPAQNVARATAFYADKLGLKPYKERADHLCAKRGH